ncbi:MAG TPA: cation:proton antiporter [Acidimicrobiia bacterium]|nr:cation:proton antiporter [Acidimicrobiia bacterium]
METFSAASHAEVLQLVIQIAVLLAAARFLGGVSRRLGQPAVVGEILAGVILGPSLLSGLIPWVGDWIIPQTQAQGYMLEVVALIGVMLLLVITGLETDLALIRRRIGVALGVAVGGLVVPFVTGLLLGFSLPDDLLVEGSDRTVFALFVATALSISAIPVLAKILMDLDLMRREFGQTVLAAGMIDDITGWTMLGLVTALASAEAITAGTVVQTVLMVVIFLLATVTAGRFLVERGLGLIQDRFRGRDAILTLVIVLAFAWGAFSQALRLEPVIGAFAVGILFGRLPRLPTEVVQKLESMALAVFAPIFFAVAGLKVDIGAILEPGLLFIAVLVILVATIGKVAGAYAGARYISGQDHWSALAYGAGLNARGAVEIIIATIGLSLGILTTEMFSIIVLMAVVTSVAAPAALRYCLARVTPGDEEERRLAREEILKGSFVSGLRRVLVPVRPRIGQVGTQTIQAVLVARLGETRDISTTLLAVAGDQDRVMAGAYLTSLRSVFRDKGTTTRIVSNEDPVGAILHEAEGDYDLLVIGTPTMSGSGGGMFGPVIDDLIKLSKTPTLVVKGENVPEDWVPSRILVPANASTSSKNAADLAFAIAGTDAVVTGVHVVTPSRLSGMRPNIALDVTAEFEIVATRMGQNAETEVREAEDVETGILEALEEFDADLLVLGTSVRAGTSHLHLGPRVEYLTRLAPCPVVILNS